MSFEGDEVDEVGVGAADASANALASHALRSGPSCSDLGLANDERLDASFAAEGVKLGVGEGAASSSVSERLYSLESLSCLRGRRDAGILVL